MSELWVERYRPKTVSEIKGQQAVVARLSAYANNKSFPHLLCVFHALLSLAHDG